MRLSRLSSRPAAPSDGAVPPRRVAFWALVGVAILAGIALYFRHGRALAPLLG